MAEGEPGARQHEPAVARRDLDRDAGRNARPLARLEAEGLQRVEVESGVSVVRTRRHPRIRVEAPDRELHAGREPFGAAKRS